MKQLLTDSKVKASKPNGDKPLRLSDGNGLVLLVTASSKRWQLRYRLNGRAGKYAIGNYPVVSLSLAREKRLEAMLWVEQGLNPTVARAAKQKHEEAERVAARATSQNTFEAVARKWAAGVIADGEWSDYTAKKNMIRMESMLLPAIGSLPITEITSKVLLDAFDKMKATGKHDTVNRCANYTKRIFGAAVARELVETDPTGVLNKHTLASPKTKHHPALTKPEDIGELLRSIDKYNGSVQTKLALQLLPFVFLRSKELRHGMWADINWDAAEWRIAGVSMKTDRGKVKGDHIIPLSRQALLVLRELYELTGSGPFLFPSKIKRGKVMSENTVNKALDLMGYKGRHTGHGFRTTASTRLHEMGFRSEWIEKQLHHVDRDGTRASYNAAEYLEQRTGMQQQWADYLDALRNGQNNVVAINSRKAG